jgi:hypothetical protein
MSSINPNNIDGTYPIAGQDNDSQGFRDNFTNIKNNLTFAKTEIDDLQSRVIVTSQLPGGQAIETQNNLNNSLLVGAQLKKTTLTVKDLGSLSGAVDVSWADSSYQLLQTNGSVALTFSGWPTSGFYGSLILEIGITNTAHTITLPSEVSVGNARIQGASVSNVITVDTVDIIQLEFSTWDNGDTITVKDLSRNYDTTDGSFNVSGNLTIAGGRRDTGYLHIGSPASDFSTQANVGISRVVIDPSATIANGTLTLPQGNVDATIVTVSSTADITAFAIKGYGNVVVKPSANVTLTAGTSVEYFYKASEWKWYKVR